MKTFKEFLYLVMALAMLWVCIAPEVWDYPRLASVLVVILGCSTIILAVAHHLKRHGR